MEKNFTNQEAIAKLKKLAEDVTVCMLATAGNTDDAYGRPMYTIKVEEDGTIWFFTKDDKQVADQAEQQDKVWLYYSHPGKNTYLTVKGSAAIVKDKEKMKELWTPMLKAWFKDGLDEADIALLKVTPEEAHYWDVDAAKLVILFAMVKTAITGETTDMGNHGTLKVS